jgi:hypothetical protein
MYQGSEGMKVQKLTVTVTVIGFCEFSIATVQRMTIRPDRICIRTFRYNEER